MVTREDVINELNGLIHDSPERFSVEVMTGLKNALKYIEDKKENGDTVFENGVEKGTEDALGNFQRFMYDQMLKFRISDEALAFINVWIERYKNTLKKENDHE